LTTVLAGILIFCGVFGLKPERAFLFCFTSLPKPGKTNSTFFFLIDFVREVAEYIDEYSGHSFVGFGGNSESDLKLAFGHVWQLFMPAQWQHSKRIARSSFSTHRKNQPYSEPEQVCSPNR
jgi:hypothetical protein